LADDVIVFLFKAVKGFNSCILLLEAYFVASQEISNADGSTFLHRFLEIFCSKITPSGRQNRITMTDQVKNVKLTSEQQKEKETYMQWAKRKYNEQYEKWMPWIEDKFLRFFTKDNKASYATRSTFPSLSRQLM